MKNTSHIKGPIKRVAGLFSAFASIFKAVCEAGIRIMGNNIEGRVVVITGANSGLGEATAFLMSNAKRSRKWQRTRM